MVDTRAVIECLFCPQTFDTAAAKDDHVLEHFARVECVECNQNLIRVGSFLYTKHDAMTCIKRAVKTEEHIETCFIESLTVQNDTQCVSNIVITPTHLADESSIKVEPQNTTENTNTSTDYNLLDEFDDPANSECDRQSMTFDIESKLQKMLGKEKIQIDVAEQIENDNIETENKEVSGNQFECEACGTFLKSKCGLSKHTILKHSADVIYCNLCVRVFSTIADRDVHRSACAAKRRKPTKKSHPDLRCDLCDTQCDTEKVYRSHMLEVHGQRIKLVKCKYCDAGFLKKSWLFEHQCPEKLAQMSDKKKLPEKQEGADKNELNIYAEQIERNDKEPKNNGRNADTVDLIDKFKCKVCGNILKSKFGLSKHTLIKHSPDAIFCNICARIFCTIADRDVHRSACAAKKRKPTKKSHPELRCDLCNVDKKYDNERTYRTHMLKKHAQIVKSVKCIYCRANFLKESWLSDHQCPEKIVKTSEEMQVLRGQRAADKIQCYLCFAKLKSIQHLRFHVKMRHDTTIKKFKCTTCGAIFMKESTLQAHKCPKHPCNMCDGEFLFPATLRLHQIRFHTAPEMMKRYCDICTKLFSTVGERDEHRLDCAMKRKMKAVEDKEIEKFECYICKKKICAKGYLRKHMLTQHDSNVDKLKCKSCCRIFLRESSLQQHRCKGRPTEKSHRDKELVPCEFCGKVLTRGAIGAHKTAFHSPAGTIYCKVCFKIFSTFADLNPHQAKCISRQKVKRACDICGVILANIRSLRKHKISLHSPKGTVFCRTCVKKFKTTDELNAHIQECTLKRKLYKIKLAG